MGDALPDVLDVLPTVFTSPSPVSTPACSLFWQVQKHGLHNQMGNPYEFSHVSNLPEVSLVPLDPLQSYQLQGSPVGQPQTLYTISVVQRTEKKKGLTWRKASIYLIKRQKKKAIQSYPKGSGSLNPLFLI